jgi:transposase
MGMGRKKDREKQQDLWVASSEMITTPGHLFYERLNTVLNAEKFDQRIEAICRKYYKSSSGRPSMTPGTYFRMLLLGYFEGIESERGMAWRAADSLSFREFLGYDLRELTPDHSTVSRTRRLYSIETHRAVMKWVLKILRKHGLADGQSVCIDATTLQANASMKSLVRRDTGQTYDDYLRQLAEAEGLENPTKEQLARLDRKRKKKASNDDWTNPHDPTARITRMKDGCTKLAYKAEHGVDLASGAVLAVTVQPADCGDTTSYAETLDVAQSEATQSHPQGIEEVVMDKGYHSGAVLVDLAEREIRSYVPEPERGKRHWSGREQEQHCVYANRRRVRAERSKRLQKLRGELCERTFAHCYETGGMRQVHVRGSDNVLKRVLVQAAAFNIGLLLRKLSGWGKPRQAQGRKNAVIALLGAVFAVQSAFRAA